MKVPNTQPPQPRIPRPKSTASKPKASVILARPVTLGGKIAKCFVMTMFITVNLLAIFLFGVLPQMHTRLALPPFLQTDAVIEAAHRGYSSQAPENTLASIKVAAQKRVTVVETDLLLTLDDVVVVSHDYTLHGYTNATGTIIDMNWDDIKYAQVTRGGRPEGVQFVVEDTRVASFEQFIVEAKKHGIKMFVELKEVRDRTDVLIREFVRILRTHKYTDQVVLLSFFPSIITRVKELEPSIYSTMLFHPTGLSVWCDLRVHSNSLVWKVVCQRPDILDEVAFNFVLPVASWFKADAVGLAVPTLTKEVVSKFLNSGFGVFAWTVNSREEKSRLMSDGVRILISDCPGGECDSVMTHFPPATKPPMLRSGR